MGRSSSVAAALIVALISPATAAARGMTFNDYARIVSVSSASVAPDGKRIVVTVRRPNFAKDSYASELVLVDVATGRQRILTVNRPHVADPQWSPDGSRLAFVDVEGRGEDAASQVWVMPMSGGDPKPVTHATTGVDAYAWRPDGEAVAYVAADQAPKRDGNDLFHVGDDSFMTRSLPQLSHIWVQPLNGAPVTKLTRGTSSVYPERLSWSPDGRYIAFERIPGARFNDLFLSRVAVVDVRDGSVRQIGGNGWGLMPEFAPNSDNVAYTLGHDGSFVTLQDPAVASADGNHRYDPAPDLDRDIGFITWMPDGLSLLASGTDRTQKPLWLLRNGRVHRFDLGDVNFEGGSVAKNGAIAFVGSTSTDPGELYYLPPGAQSSPVKLTNYNAAIASLDLSTSREFTWNNDGFVEYGVLTYPIGYVTGKTYPLVLVIHGGPTSESSTTTFDPLVQMLAAHGAIVLQPNYRGSDDSGFRFAHAIVGPTPPLGAAADCVAAVKALERTGAVDASRIGVSGWSAGGWLTSWLITHYDLWKAAVSGAAVDDTVLQYSLSQLPIFFPYLFGGLTPWKGEGVEAYRRSSPITYAANVNAPLLILSDTGDQRVPTPEAYEFFSALRDLGKTVEFIAIPANGHHPSDPVRSRAVDQSWVDWMVKYLVLH